MKNTPDTLVSKYLEKDADVLSIKVTLIVSIIRCFLASKTSLNLKKEHAWDSIMKTKFMETLGTQWLRKNRGILNEVTLPLALTLTLTLTLT